MLQATPYIDTFIVLGRGPTEKVWLQAYLIKSDLVWRRPPRLIHLEQSQPR